MRSRTKIILFSLTAVLLFASMIQQATGAFSFKELSGVTETQTHPVFSFQNLREGTYQSETEAYLKQHYGKTNASSLPMTTGFSSLGPSRSIIKAELITKAKTLRIPCLKISKPKRNG